MDDLSTLKENGNDAARLGLLRLHDAVVRRESGRPEASLSPEELLAQFRAADPTRNAACLTWLLRTYAAGGYRLEDLSKAHDTLVAFARLRGCLPNTAIIDGETRNPRKLGSHLTLASLWKAVAPLVEAERLAEESEAGERPDTDKERALSQSRVIHRSNRMVIVVPMTVEASCWWGQGTQWCTAARNNNAFEDYHKSAPLIVICLRKIGDLPARKLQLHVHAGDMQFMDENDAPVSKEIILERWHDLEALVHWAIHGYGRGLEHVPEHLRVEALCLPAVSRNGEALKDVPEYLRTEAVCLAAVCEYGWALEYVPGPLRMKAMCLAAVGRNGYALDFVPNYLCTEAMYLAAVVSDGRTLQFVPKLLRTKAMCTAAVEQDGTALEYVPEPLRTKAICTVAVIRDGIALEYVPARLRTEAICSSAVGSDGWALIYVPEPLRTKAICSVAVIQDARALEHVPKPLLTEEICITAVGRNGLALYYLPEPQRTEAICTVAVGRDGRTLQHVPEHLRTEAICTTAVGGHGGALRYVPELLRTKALCLAAVTENSFMIKYVPEYLRVEITRSATEAQDKQKSVSINSQNNERESHDLVLDGLEDYLNNSKPSIQNTSSVLKLAIH